MEGLAHILEDSSSILPARTRFFANSQLVKTGRTADAEMPHSRDMLQVEDVSEDALPSTVDDDNAVVQGAMKYQQVGFFKRCKFIENCRAQILVCCIDIQ